MKTVIVDDDSLFRELVTKACRSELGLDVVAEVATGTAAVSHIESLNPDIVILDLSLPDFSGMEVIRRTHLHRPPPKFVVVSCHCEEYTAYHLERSRISGFVDKGVDSLRDLANAISAIQEGRIYLSSTFQRTRLNSISNPNSFLKLLSDQEMVVLCFIGRGMDDVEIASKLEISLRTVQKHRGRITAKLRIKSMGKLVIFAMSKGLSLFGCQSNRPISR